VEQDARDTGKAYLSVKLDSRSSAPVNGALMEQEDGFIWSERGGRKKA